MGRAPFHTTDRLCDAVRNVIYEKGVRAATIAAVADEAGAPTGSIYHRFKSVDELLARSWLRAAQRSQAHALAASPSPDAEGVVETALALYDFCLGNRADAVLLGSFRHADFAHLPLPPDLSAEMRNLNQPVLDRLSDWVQHLYDGEAQGLDVLLVALVDLPYAMARRYLDSDATPPRQQRQRLERMVRALLADSP